MSEYYYQGYDAYYAGKTDCPYKTKTPQAAEWLRGWREAKRDNELPGGNK